MNDAATPSPQPPIALLVVDLQRGMQRSDLPPRNNPGAEARIAELLAAWRATGWPVVHIRHISRQPASPFAPGQPGVEFQPALAPRDDEAVFEKNVPDAFVNSGLQRWLHARDIRHLAIAGVATENSVEASARSAGNLGFHTWVVADALLHLRQNRLPRHSAQRRRCARHGAGQPARRICRGAACRRTVAAPSATR
ncbi:isochorismatase family protein [Pseudomonas aeruginosa]|nr:isochorismatase family protein [Pseudomonas aeruginosa]